MYRGSEGQWAFYLHRISGIGILVFLVLHVLNIASAMWGPEVSNAFMKFYHQPVFQLGLLVLIAGVLYHGFNGLRIILMDFTSWGVRYQKQLWYAAWVLFVVFYLPFLVKIGGGILGGAMAIKSKRYQEARLEASTNLELYWWVFMRVSGVVLVFLLIGHMWMNAVLVDLNSIDYDYVAKRLSQTTWKVYDWLILALALLHGGNGLRYVLDDWVRDPMKRFWTKVVVYSLLAFLFFLGSLSLFNHDFGVN